MYKELKPKSANERVITNEERQDMKLFLRHRMKADGSLPYGTVNEAAGHFGRHRATISQIHKELKPKSGYERGITDEERQHIMLFLRHRMKADESLPYGTVNEAAEHFGRHRTTISQINKELKPKSGYESVITDQI
jgi:hypothetical protein